MFEQAGCVFLQCQFENGDVCASEFPVLQPQVFKKPAKKMVASCVASDDEEAEQEVDGEEAEMWKAVSDMVADPLAEELDPLEEEEEAAEGEDEGPRADMRRLPRNQLLL
jgi:hypothetical protein